MCDGGTGPRPWCRQIRHLATFNLTGVINLKPFTINPPGLRRIRDGDDIAFNEAALCGEAIGVRNQIPQATGAVDGTGDALQGVAASDGVAADATGVAVVEHLEEGVVAGVDLALVFAFCICAGLGLDVAVGVVVFHPFCAVFAVIVDFAEYLVIGVVDVVADFFAVFAIAFALVDGDELVVLVVDEGAVAVGVTKGADAVFLSGGVDVVQVLEGLVDLVVNHMQAVGDEVASIVIAVGGFLHAGFLGARVVVGAAPHELAALVVAAAGGFGDHAAFEFGIEGDIACAVVFPLLAAAIGAAGVGDAVVGVVAVGGGDAAYATGLAVACGIIGEADLAIGGDGGGNAVSRIVDADVVNADTTSVAGDAGAVANGIVLHALGDAVEDVVKAGQAA